MPRMTGEIIFKLLTKKKTYRNRKMEWNLNKALHKLVSFDLMTPKTSYIFKWIEF